MADEVVEFVEKAKNDGKKIYITGHSLSAENGSGLSLFYDNLCFAEVTALES
ncbi:MAG: hypothetical protein GY702_13365 [Desulfobulbaceae bacterium]|nr:hypothetical protein [Desulfobulbaceae bacterium]